MKCKFLNVFIMAGVLVSAPLYPKDIINSPDTLERWLITNFDYKMETGDNWKTPEQTVLDKGGDCEDFAFLVEAILKDLGYEAKPIWIYGKHKKGQITESYSHAICIFKINDKWRYFSNTYYFSKEFDTIKDVVYNDCPQWKWYGDISLLKPNEALNKIWR